METGNIQDEKLRKVVLVQEYEDSEETDVESPWALDLGDGQYQLKNFPFFFYGLSYDDVFEAEFKYEDDPRPYFVKVIQKSGHRTIRILLKDPVDESTDCKDFLKQLSAMQCGYEGNGARFFIINVQPQCNVEQVLTLIKNSSLVEQWESADPIEEEEDVA